MDSEGVRPADFAKIPDDAVDLVARGVDSKGRLGLPPEVAVEIAALTRGLALAESTVELVTKAAADPTWAKVELQKIIATVGAEASRRVSGDQRAEAEILRALMRPAGHG